MRVRSLIMAAIWGPAQPTAKKLTRSLYLGSPAHCSSCSAQGQHPPHWVKRWISVGFPAKEASELGEDAPREGYGGRRSKRLSGGGSPAAAAAIQG